MREENRKNKCAKIQKQFIYKCHKIHNRKYDYSKVEYKNSKDKVKIICPIHGEFLQSTSNHFKHGCPKCANENNVKKQIKSLETFLAEANKVHKNKYLYNKAKYQGAHNKIIIICPEHGDFEQEANSHIKGRGCPLCKQGKNHPRYGKPSASAAYFGTYKGNTFRSLPELFWILDAEQSKTKFVALDQEEHRPFWQVEVINDNGKVGTYCADFFIVDENKVIDIKPVWRTKKEHSRLSQGKQKYLDKGYSFEFVDTDSIKTDFFKFAELVETGEVFLFPASVKRFKKRRSKKKWSR